MTAKLYDVNRIAFYTTPLIYEDISYPVVADEIHICMYKLTWINSSWMFHCVWPNDRSLGHMVNTHACKHASPAPACTAAAKKVWGTSGAMEALSHIIAHQWRARYGKGNKDYIELVCVLVEGVLPSR